MWDPWRVQSGRGWWIDSSGETVESQTPNSPEEDSLKVSRGRSRPTKSGQVEWRKGPQNPRSFLRTTYHRSRPKGRRNGKSGLTHRRKTGESYGRKSSGRVSRGQKDYMTTEAPSTRRTDEDQSVERSIGMKQELLVDRS